MMFQFEANRSLSLSAKSIDAQLGDNRIIHE